MDGQGPLDPAKLVVPQPPGVAGKRFYCKYPNCPRSATGWGNLRKHVRRDHEGLKHMCFKCDPPRELSSDGNLWQHVKSFHDGAVYTCHKCDPNKVYRFPQLLRQHDERVHLGRLFICEECGKECRSAGNLRRHIDGDHLLIRYNCNIEFPDGKKCCAVIKERSNFITHTKHIHFTEYAARRRQQESIVEDLLLPAFPHGAFKREHQINNACLGADLLGDAKKFARADFLFPYTLRHDTCVMLEVDEHGHEDYIVKCETARMYNQVETLRAEGNTQKFVFVRYNPHAFKVDGVTLRTGREERHAELLRVLRAIADGPADVPDVRVIYLFYDRDAAGRPDVLDDPDYDETVASWWCTEV